MTTARQTEVLSASSELGVRGRTGRSGGLVVLAAAACFAGTGALMWNAQPTAAAAVQGVLCTTLCCIAVLPSLRSVSSLFTPLVAITASQVCELALPLPALAPVSRLAVQGIFLWVVLACSRWSMAGATKSSLGLRRPRSVGRATARLARRVAARTGRVLLVVASGVLLGFAVWAVLPSYPLHPAGGVAGLVLEAAALVVMVVVPEELLWRGQLSGPLWEALGPLGAVVEAFLYASLYSNAASVELVLVAFVAALGASITRKVTGSVRGPILAHALAAALAFVILPGLL